MKWTEYHDILLLREIIISKLISYVFKNSLRAGSSDLFWGKGTPRPFSIFPQKIRIGSSQASIRKAVYNLLCRNVGSVEMWKFCQSFTLPNFLVSTLHTKLPHSHYHTSKLPHCQTATLPLPDFRAVKLPHYQTSRFPHCLTSTLLNFHTVTLPLGPQVWVTKLLKTIPKPLLKFSVVGAMPDNKLCQKPAELLYFYLHMHCRSLIFPWIPSYITTLYLKYWNVYARFIAVNRLV